MASDWEENSTYDDVEEMSEGEAAESSFKQTLFNRIHEIQATGSYATGNVLQSVPIPGICVDGGEPIAIPLSNDAAEDVAKKSDQAPFGRHGQTVIDETVRKTLQIGAERISFKNPQWAEFVNKLVQRVAKELGVPPAPDGPTIHAELYKNLLYPPGAMFKSHQDTEKDARMFATLVICLPSEHTGGTVCLQHGDASIELSTAETSAFNYYYLAWYTDVTHEIKPVQTGYRWVLTYNLIMGDRKFCLSASTLDSQTENLVQALSSWERLESKPDFLLYPLDHQYTPRNLCLSSLKGLDYQHARCLADSCDRHGEFYLLLAQHNKFKTWGNDEGGTEDTTRRTYLDNISSLEGFVLSNEAVDVDKSTLLVPINYHDRDPDYRAGGEYLGNQHQEIEENYEDMVLVIVRKTSIAALLLGSNSSPQSVNTVMTNLLRSVNNNASATLETILIHLWHVILDEGVGAKEANDGYLDYVAVTSASLGHWEIFKQAQEKTRKGWDMYSWSKLGGLIDLQDGSVDANDIYNCMVKCKNLRRIYQLLTRFYNGFCVSNIGREDPAKATYWKQWYSDSLIRTLNECKNCTGEDDAVTIKEITVDLDVKYTPAQKNKVDEEVINLVDRFKDNKKFVNALTVELLLVLSKPDSARTPFLRRVFDIILEAAILTFDLELHYAYAYRVLFHQDYSDTLIRDFYSQALAHGEDSALGLLRQFSSQAYKTSKDRVLTIILPVIKQLLPLVDTRSPEVQACFQSLVEAYIAQTVGKEPPKPEDWARPKEVYECWSRCKGCTQLNAFVTDPKAKEETIAMSDGDQRHVKYRFQYLEFEQGNREGEFRITKTLREWERCHEDWESKANRVQEQLRDMPKELKEALGDKYDTLMVLDLVRIDRSIAEQGGISQASDRSPPSTRPKRSRDNEAQDTELERTSKHPQHGEQKSKA